MQKQQNIDPEKQDHEVVFERQPVEIPMTALQLLGGEVGVQVQEREERVDAGLGEEFGAEAGEVEFALGDGGEGFSFVVFVVVGCRWVVAGVVLVGIGCGCQGLGLLDFRRARRFDRMCRSAFCLLYRSSIRTKTCTHSVTASR